MKIVWFMLKFSLFAYVSSLLMASSLAQNETWLFSAEYCNQGEAFEAFVQGTDIFEVHFSLQDNSNTAVSKNEGWQLEESLYATLVGVPSDLAPGEYKLVAEVNLRGKDLRLEKSVTVNESQFSQMDVRLSNKMTNIFDSQSETKKAEAVDLWTVISSFNPQSVFHMGNFSLPVLEGRATGRYGDRRNYIRNNAKQTSSIHKGHDFAANRGTLIFAPGRGRVVMTAQRIVTGNTVIIEHLPGVHTLYYHLDEIRVINDELVEEGTVLGTVGSTGFSTGNHLHWELRVGTVAVNPMSRLSTALIDIGKLSDRM